MKRLVLAAICTLGLGACAPDYQKGVDAAARGDYETAIEQWQPLAAQGHPEAQSRLGQSYFQGTGVARDYEQASKWVRQAAEQGEPEAQALLGQMYQSGLGVERSDEEAAIWYQKAADRGQPFAQYRLGLMLLDGPERRAGPGARRHSAGVRRQPRHHTGPAQAGRAL